MANGTIPKASLFDDQTFGHNVNQSGDNIPDIIETPSLNLTDERSLNLTDEHSLNITDGHSLNLTDEYRLYLMKMWTINTYVNCGFITLCVPFILGGNLLTILSVLKFRQLQTVMNIYIVSLAFADLTVGFPTIPMYVVHFLYKEVHSIKYMCLLKYVFVLIGLPASILNLLVVTIDRFVAVKCPLHYVSMMTKRRAKIIIGLVWVYSVGSASMPLMGFNTWKEEMPCDFWLILPKPFTMVTVSGIMIMALPSLVIMYILIFAKIKRSKAKMAKYKTNSNIHATRLNRDARRAKLMAFVFLTFLIFWFPFCMISVLKYTNLHPIIIDMLKICTVSLTMSNSLVNPIIYCWIRPDFRAAFKTLVGIKKVHQLPESHGNEPSDIQVYTPEQSCSTNIALVEEIGKNGMSIKSLPPPTNLKEN